MDITPILATDSEDNFKPLKTVPAFSFHLLISTIISVTGIILALTWKDGDRCEAYFIMLYLRAAFWVLTFIFDHIVKYEHKKLKLNGYHDFHRATEVHKGIPLYIVTLWNTTIAVIQTLMQQIYGENFQQQCFNTWFSPIVYVTLFSILETLILSGINGSYISKVRVFNNAQPVPDALRGCHSNSGSVGLTQSGADMTELLEKQADLINYLKDHNLKLNQKLMQLNAQYRTVTIHP